MKNIEVKGAEVISNIEKLEDAISLVRDNLNKGGAICPCCQQFTKVYKRKISGSSAYGLVRLYQKYGKKEFHLERALKELNILKIVRSDFPKLRYWDLIIQHKGKREDGSSRNGYYNITDRGVLFIFNHTKVQKYAHIYNNLRFQSSGDLVLINDCWDEKFDYNELMGNV